MKILVKAIIYLLLIEFLSFKLALAIDKSIIIIPFKEKEIPIKAEILLIKKGSLESYIYPAIVKKGIFEEGAYWAISLINIKKDNNLVFLILKEDNSNKILFKADYFIIDKPIEKSIKQFKGNLLASREKLRFMQDKFYKIAEEKFQLQDRLAYYTKNITLTNIEKELEKAQNENLTLKNKIKSLNEKLKSPYLTAKPTNYKYKLNQLNLYLKKISLAIKSANNKNSNYNIDSIVKAVELARKYDIRQLENKLFELNDLIKKYDIKQR